MESFECLNGNAKVGDQVAIAVGGGMYGGGMRIGEILEVIPAMRYGEHTFDVKVKVTSGSDTLNQYPYVKIFPYPKRMVKING